MANVLVVLVIVQLLHFCVIVVCFNAYVGFRTLLYLESFYLKLLLDASKENDNRMSQNFKEKSHVGVSASSSKPDILSGILTSMGNVSNNKRPETPPLAVFKRYNDGEM